MSTPEEQEATVGGSRALAIGPTRLSPHVEHLPFRDLVSFQAHMQRTQPQWASQVQQALRLMALNGIVEPLLETVVPAAAVRVAHENYRETLEIEGCLSRHRAVLLVLQALLSQGAIPGRTELDLYCPEACTPFAARLRDLFPRVICSEYLPDPDAPLRREVTHQDLCALTLSDACVDVVVCNELFEHLADLPAALSEIGRILRPGGWLVATFQFAYNCASAITPTSAAAGEGDAAVLQIPGWDLLDQVSSAGLNDVAMHWIASPSHGVVGQEIPAVMVLAARRP